MAVAKVSDATFEREVLRSELPVLVDLSAEWCAPCKQLSPLVEELAREYEGRLKVVQVDIDKSPRVAQSFRVQSVPMLVLLAEGRLAGHHVGLLDRAGLKKFVEPVLPREGNAVKPAELAQLLAARRAVPVDVRDGASFGRYRIPGAQHLAAAEVPAKAATLRPTDGRIRVLYGRSTDEAKALADQLGKLGVEAAYLDGGFLHWEADGLQVERGDAT